MTSDLFGVGLSGLRAARVQLEVSSSNVANANTPGYTRRSALLISDAATGGGYVQYSGITSGSAGVRIDGIERGYDQFLTQDVRITGGRAANTDARAQWLGEIEGALGGREAGISGAIAQFVDGIERLSAAPTSTPLRGEVLAAADNLAAAFRETANRMENIEDGIEGTLEASVGTVNAKLEQLQEINRQLARTQEGTASGAALLDRRDAALDELSQEVPIHIEFLSKGRVLVRMSDESGPELVGETSVSALALGDPGGDGLPTLQFNANFAPQDAPIPTGGRIGGLYSALASTLSAKENLDNFAVQTADLVNGQHAAGVDLNGDPGSAIFGTTTGNPVTGAADIIMALTDPEQIASAAALLEDGVTPTPPNQEDNRNLLAMSALVDAPLTAGIARQRGDASTAFSAARDRANIANVAAVDADTTRANMTGVSLDEEAANLIRYQQSYEAAARIIATARDTFDTLLRIR
ncbi:flagellar hook-associated protein FlgK [Pacificimonas sp. WHA3]|uniref:Flagellar hook-associated protein 1 n=1 Tax=Pacificimonas pallii TaxID=2827236 RepID=A0ABS6SF74_9SPHN|nr:flagellar hook-associated protein FlgK [Pacificimonas pallii]MBV7257020.1 flagellar hook-associated protein FlgK [Pacificimonas pallii]